MVAGPSVAVVIGTRDRPALLADALESLARSRRMPDRVVVVDSASSDPKVAEVARAAGATVVRCERPGLGLARNVGLAAVDEDLVAFTDDDCLVDPGWLDSVVDAFAHHCAPGFVTGLVRSDIEVHRRLWLGVSLMDDPDPHPFGAGDDPLTFGHGANMSWRREALELIGGFDASLGVGSSLRAAEDVDAFWRALESGVTGYYAPDAVVIHRQWRSRSSMLRSYHGYGVGTGALAIKRYRMGTPASAQLARNALMRALLVDQGPMTVLRSLGRGHQMAALAQTFMFAGVLRGALAARRIPVADGHFVT
ncbi:MAG: glycosyltransferase family 2 protein [Acidimicrobiales bacterium]